MITENWRSKRGLPVFSTDVRHDVLVEELEDEWDAVGKYQMLGHVLKLGRTTETKSSAHLINLTFINLFLKLFRSLILISDLVILICDLVT